MKKILFTLVMMVWCVAIFANVGRGGQYNSLVYPTIPSGLPTHYYLTLVEQGTNYGGTLRTARADGLFEVTHNLQNVVIDEQAKTIRFEANSIVYEGTIVGETFNITINSQHWIFQKP